VIAVSDLDFVTDDHASILLDVEAATLSIPLRVGATFNEEALAAALETGGFKLASVKLETLSTPKTAE
jgi:hypothetical protein